MIGAHDTSRFLQRADRALARVRRRQLEAAVRGRFVESAHHAARARRVADLLANPTARPDQPRRARTATTLLCNSRPPG